MIDAYGKYKHCADLMVMFHGWSNEINCPYGTGFIFFDHDPINELMGYFHYIPTGLSDFLTLIFFITAATKYSNA
jgi:hypothetical protein